MDLHFTFFTIVLAIAKLFILMLVGYVLYQRKYIDDKFTDKLSLLLVYAIFPALIISKTITHFSFTEYSYWWIFPVIAALFSLIGMLLGVAIFPFFKEFESKKEFICSCGFQNCGYLPMNLILFSFSGVMADRLLIYMFLFIVGFNVLMWSLVPLFLTGKLKSGFRLKVLFNPPVVATIFSLLWVMFRGKASMPMVLMDPLKQLGAAAFPIAMITLGAYLCRYKAHIPASKMPLAACVLVKLILFPVLVLAALMWVPLKVDYKFLLFLQSIMPTAVSLVVIGSYTNSNNNFFSSSIFYTHLIAFFSIPIWLAIFQMVFLP